MMLYPTNKPGLAPNPSRMTLLLALWGMARPVIMLSVFLVYIAGLLIARAAGYSLDAEPIGWGFVALLLVSLSIHYTNEYADYETDALTRPTLYSGGSGVLPAGDVPRRVALYAAWGTLLPGLAVGIVAWALGILSAGSVALLAVGAFFGWMYSLPPLKLAWQGWGEFDNAVLGGVFLHLYGYSVLAEDISPGIALAVVPFTMLTFNNLLATTWADREADAQVGKFTLATRYTPQTLRRLYAGVALAAYGLSLALGGWLLPWSVVLGGFLALPVLAWGWRTYTRWHSPYPTSNAMVVFLFGQMLGWFVAGN
ncbi:MAG: prenyltransferase [Anaerolineales bacterium]